MSNIVYPWASYVMLAVASSTDPQSSPGGQQSGSPSSDPVVSPSPSPEQSVSVQPVYSPTAADAGQSASVSELIVAAPFVAAAILFGIGTLLGRALS